eukprot:scaffold43883_cov32-Tisochrysis_lutea.AAC.6
MACALARASAAAALMLSCCGVANATDGGDAKNVVGVANCCEGCDGCGGAYSCCGGANSRAAPEFA